MTNDTSYWQHKVALVTGASSGFGWALTRQLAESGARVVLADLDEPHLNQAVEQLAAQGYDVKGVVANVTRMDQVEAMVSDAVGHFGHLDLLANIVGRSARGSVLDTSPEAFRDLLETNFLSMVHCTRAAAPHLICSQGHLVNMGSLAAKSAARYLGAYPVSKFAVAAYSQQLRYELRSHGVHVLLVCPGPLARSDSGRRYDEQTTDLPAAARQPGGGVRLKGIPPEKLAQLVLWACEKRVPELVVPARARLLFAMLQLWPAAGDWLLLRMTGGEMRETH